MNHYNTPDERSQAPLSIVRGINPKIVTVTTLGDVLKDIKQQSQQISFELAHAYRNDKAAYNKLKGGLHGFIAGRFTKRDAESCELYVPLIILDIDGCYTQEDAETLFNAASEIEYTYACFLSPSGHGLRILVFADNGENGHESAYSRVTAFYAQRMGVDTDTEIKAKFGAGKAYGEHFDTSAKAFPRFWYYSYNDVFLFVNEHAKTFTLDVNAPPVTAAPAVDKKETPSVFLLNDKKKDEKKPVKPQSAGASLGETLTHDMIIEVVTDAVNRNAPSGRNNFVFNFAVLAVENGLPDDVIADHCLSFEEEGFTASEIAATVKSALKRTTRKHDDKTVLAFYHKLKKTTPSVQTANKSAVNVSVVEFPKKTPPSVVPPKDDAVIDYRASGQHQVMRNENKFIAMCDYLNQKYEFRFNEVANEGEIRFKDNSIYNSLNLSGLECELMEYGLGGCEKMLKAFLGNPNYCPVYDVFEEFFQSLPKWNGEDHIAKLANYVETEESPEWWHKMFRKALIRTVACALRKTQNRNCLTLFGTEQNVGKSRFIRFLVPPDLRLYYKEGLSNPTSKDGKLELVQNFIINLDDLDGKSKWDVGQLKSTFSMASVKERPFFGTSPRLFDRRCSFFASTNKDDILVDETGSTRWNIIRVKKILHDEGGAKGYSKNVDIIQLWAQAFAAFKGGEKYDLTSEEMNASEEKNKNFQKTTLEMELILKYMECDDEDPTAFATSAEIKATLEKVAGLHYALNISHIGRALATMKVGKRTQRVERFKYPIHGYRVRLRPEYAANELPPQPFAYEAHNSQVYTTAPSVPYVTDDLPF